MNQPSGSIIEIGAVAGNLLTGEVYERFSRFVRLPPGEILSPEIIKLTTIQPEDLGKTAHDLWDAFIDLRALHVKYECFISPLTWGGNDTTHLWEQLQLFHPTRRIPWTFGFRVIDVKTGYILYRAKQRLKVRAGLSKAQQRIGAGPFQGTKHRAVDDAFNTFLAGVEFLKKIVAP